MRKAASDRASAIFFSLSRLPAEERSAALDEQCSGDAALRAEVEALLGTVKPEDSFAFADANVSAEHGIPLTAGTVIRDFVLLRQIGAGGTGVVYLAQQRHPSRIVALKVLRREFVASSVHRRFEAEAELLAHLHDPGIAQVFAAHPGDEMTPPFIAMELVNGPPITEYADAHQLSVRDRVDLMARVCDAVQHAHQRRVIHRDLKPGNILVGEHGQPKVLDFGVARREDASSFTTFGTETGQLLGTLAYMSPEQILADPDGIDTRTDIHALGVILFRLLAGRLPFSHDEPSLPELARRIVEDEPPRLGTIDRSLKGDIEVIVARAMTKEKERRYPSAAGLAADLRRFLAGHPISASADSAWYLVRRRLGRYRAAVKAGAVVLVLVAGLAIYASLQRSRAARVNVELEHQLATSTIERGRLVSLTGNHPVAEELVWREFFRNPDSTHAQWALWDIYSREPTVWTRFEHEGGTQTIRLSPDGRLVATGGRVDGEVHLVAVNSGELVRRFVLEPQSGLLRVLFTPDGTSVLAASGDETIRIWDVATGQLEREPQRIPGLRDFAIASNGDHIATVGARGFEVWSRADGTRLEDFSLPEERATKMCMDRAGTLAVLGAVNGTVTTLRLGERRPRWRAQPGSGMILSLAISPDAHTVVSSGIDGMVRLWNASTGEGITSFPAENARIRAMAFNGAGTALVVGGQWRTRIWDMRELSAAPRDVGRSEEIGDLDVTSDGRTLVTSSGMGVRMWDLQADARAARWNAARGGIIGLAVANTGRTLLVGDRETFATVQPDEQEREEHPIAVPVSFISASADARWVVTVGPPASSAVWEVATGRRAADLPLRAGSRAAIFADGARRIVVGDGRGDVSTWEWSNGILTNPRTFTPLASEVLALLSRGAKLFVAHRDRTVTELNLETGREIRRIHTSASPFSLALTPDGRQLAVGTYTGIIELWDVVSGEKRADLKGQTSLIHRVDISPDGTLLATSSRDGTTRLWTLDGQFLATIAARSAAALNVSFFPDGWRLAIGYADGELEVRDLNYFFRHTAGQAEYQLRLRRQAGETFPRAHEVLAWSRRVLIGSR